MIPKQQKVKYWWYTKECKSFQDYCKSLINEGWVIIQIIPSLTGNGYFLLLNKY